MARFSSGQGWNRTLSVGTNGEVTALRRVEACMGTVFSIDVRNPVVAESVVDQCVRWLHWVDATFSTYRAASEISRLARGELTRASCSAAVRAVLCRCDKLKRDTGGYFSAHATGALDPSGYVKGWAIERVSHWLVSAGASNHCVNGGGDVQCAGEAAPGQPWRIAIAHPLEPGALAGIVEGAGVAVATSGSAERGHHIVDPHTGQAARALASLTVIGSRLAETDAYATAAFAMGAAAHDWIVTLPGHWAFAVTASGATWSAGLGR